MKILCEIYKSSKEEELYLFVNRNDGLARVPGLLLEKFGKPQRVTIIPLTADRKLARADAGKVLDAIREKGYYLQLPPPKDAYMQELRQRNDKL